MGKPPESSPPRHRRADDTAARLTPRGLRFGAAAIEADYQDWRIGTTIPFVRLGMIVSFGNWVIYLLTLRVIQPQGIPLVLPAILSVVVPLIAVAFTVTWIRAGRRLIMPLTALANCAAGAVVAWQLHEVLAAPGFPGVMAGTNLILMFFAFTIFRMPPGLALAAVAPYLTLVLVLLHRDFSQGVLSRVEYGAQIAVQLVGVFTGLLACGVLELVSRRAYRNHRVIRAQRAALEHSREQIRRYVPPSVAERIMAGDTEAIAAPRRQRVTVLFSDIVGFTDMADRLDAEALTDIINEYMATMAEIIEAHCGTLNEFAGDGIMALFGAPTTIAPEQQVRSAIDAARAMQARLLALNARWLKLGIGEPLQTRIGINTGVLSVGSFGSAGRMTYTAIGLQTNVAARIQSRCEPGEILISDTSWQLIRDDMTCTPRGDIKCKGVHYPITVYSPDT